MTDGVIFTEEAAGRIAKAVRQVESRRDRGDSGGGRHSEADVAWCGVITLCKITSGNGQGFAEVKETAGPGSTTPVAGAKAVHVWIGLHSVYRKGTVIWVSPARGKSPAGKVIRWRSAGLTQMTLYKHPGSDGSVLAELQDDPDEDEYCTDSVSVT